MGLVMLLVSEFSKFVWDLSGTSYIFIVDIVGDPKFLVTKTLEIKFN